MKTSYLPRLDKEKLLWLKNFSSKLGVYATKYNLAATDVSDMVASANYFDWFLNYRNIYVETTKKLTQFKNELMDGIQAGAVSSILPSVPVTPAAPPTVAPDIFGRATAIGNRIKSHKDYTLADGNDLGLEGAIITTDLSTVKPKLNITLNAGKPEITWQKNGLDALEVLVDRGTGSYVFLTIATQKLIKDTHPTPPFGTAQHWKYKAIYRQKDQQIGQWSDEVSVKV
jgi:hypothetical protein